jgi:hypothetical protein
VADFLRVRGAAAVLAGLAAALLLQGPAAAQSAPLLVVEGSAAATAVVDLPRPSVVKAAALFSEQVAVSGDGRVVGLVLEQLAPEPRAVLVAVNYNLCADPGCSAADRQEYVAGRPASGEGAAGEDVRLPAGRYRLTLLADGRPVRVAVALDGLDESLPVRPTGPSSVVYRPIEGTGQEAPPPFRNLFSGGRTYPAGQSALVLTQQLYRTAATAAGVAGTCVVRGEAPPADAYAPGCPTAQPSADRVEFTSPVTVLDPSSVLVASYAAIELGQDSSASIGHYLASASPVVESSVTQVEVPLSAAPPDPDLTAPPSAGSPAPPGVDRDAQSMPVSPASELAATGGSGPKALLVAACVALAVSGRLMGWLRRPDH